MINKKFPEDEWIVVGSSPGASEFPQLRAQLPDAVTITTNRGYKLFTEDDPPQVYFLCDLLDLVPGRVDDDGSEASERFLDCRAAGRSLHDNGCHVIGHIRNAQLRDQWGLDWFDELIIAEVGSWRPWSFQRGKYTAARLSGLFALQYAINKGAKRVHLIGCEGYAKGGHYFDKGEDSPVGDDFTTSHIEPFTWAVIKACPDVHFTFYGDLNYKVVGTENVTQCKTVDVMDTVVEYVGKDKDSEAEGQS